MAIRPNRIFLAAWMLAVVFTMRPEHVFGREPTGWDLLQQGGYVVLIRHATAPGSGDPPDLRLDDCATQRNLSEEGRSQARTLGESFRRSKVPIEKVYSSQWCRCKDTARLAFGTFEENSVLNSFFGQPELEAPRTEAMKAFLMQARPSRGNLVLVTHQVNITALTGIMPSPGELFAVAIDDIGNLEVKFRLTAAD
jgi:phosphohistidine phosphatase SixA